MNMRTIFSCFLGALLLAACRAQRMPPKATKTDGLFQQAINYLKLLIPKEKDTGTFLHSPTNSIKDCCAKSALDCFIKELNSTTQNNPLKMKLARNLGKPGIKNSMNNCTTAETECKSCESYPRVSSKEFLMNLQSHLQKVYSRLS